MDEGKVGNSGQVLVRAEGQDLGSGLGFGTLVMVKVMVRLTWRFARNSGGMHCQT